MGFKGKSGSVTCLHAVNLRVKSGAMVSTWTGKPGKMRKFSSQGILNRLEKFGNFAQNEEILASFYHNFFFDFLIEVYLFNRFLNLVKFIKL